MVSGEALSEAWVARLAATRPTPLLDARGADLVIPAPGRVRAPVATRLDAMTDGNRAGTYLVAVAATRLVLAAFDTESTRPAVLMPSPGRSGELALCAPLDRTAPVSAFLTALHRELESAAALAWTDRSSVVRRLGAVDPVAAAAVGQIGLVCDGDVLTAPVHVTVSLHRQGGDLVVEVSGPGLSPATAALAPCVAAAIAAVVDAPHQPCAGVDVLGAEQRAELTRWSGLPCPADLPARTLVNVLDEAAARWPDRPAVVTTSSQLSHRDLAARATNAAAVLAARHRIGRGDRVALLLRRSPELVVAIHAVLRAGASYVPLDPAHPPARWARQLTLSGARWVVTSGAVATPLDGVEVVDVAELTQAPSPSAVHTRSAGSAAPVEPFAAHLAATAPCTAAALDPDDEAMLLFTSGSAGLPRPVAIRHRQIAHKAVSSAQRVGFDEQTRIAMLAAISSDMLAYHVFTTMSVGGAVVPMHAVEEMDPSEFWAFLRETQINTVNCVPSLLAVLAEAIGEGEGERLRHCFLGGDFIPVGLLPRLAKRLRIGTFANLYGPTEATIEAVGFLCDGADLAGLSSVPIGTPSPGYAVAVLTSGGDLTPVGVPGEIHVLGPAVADGYRDDEPAGPGRFVELAVAPGVRAFRTGDYGRWRADGQLEFLGRRDRQVQIHGNRVELGEIEAALAALPEVSTSAVVAVNDPRRPPLIIAGYTGDVTAESVRGWLADQLPGVMVPGRIVRLDAIPRTLHGKVDGAAIAAAAQNTGTAWEPEDEAGRTVARAWAEVLGRPPRAADEDFFAAGGHSLSAALLAGRLCAADSGYHITVRQVFRASTPDGLVAALRASTVPRRVGRVRSSTPASNAQVRMWILEQYDDAGLRPYNVVEAYRLHGPVDPDALAEALNQLVTRHEALRTVLRLDGDQLNQVVLPPEQARVNLVVCERELAEVLAAEQRRRAALDTPPILQAYLLAGDSVLVLSVHHSACDGWSLAVLLRDLIGFLDPAVTRPNIEPVQYAEHSLDLATRDVDADREFWRRTLAGLPDVGLPLDRRRGPVRDSAAATVRRSLGEDTTARLRELCADLGVTLFSAVVAAVRLLLLRLCHANDVALGTIVSGRDDPRLAHSVGFFANTIVMRTPVDPGRGFADLVTAVAAAAREAREHEEYPFGAVVDDLARERVAGRNPLFDVLVESVFSGVLVDDVDLSARVTHIPVDAGAAGFDLTIGVTDPTAGPVELALTYLHDVFDDNTVRRIADLLCLLLAELTADPSAPVGGFTALPDDQRADLIEAATGRVEVYPATETLLDLVARQVSLRPDAPAVVHGTNTLTFAELDEAAARLAARLGAVAQVGPGQVVGVVCERTEWMVVALVAVLKTGAAFLPLDPDQPATRLAGMLRTGAAIAVLTDPGDTAALDDTGLPVVALADTPPDTPAAFPPALPLDLAYVVCTSGSTGTPKGVMVEHRAIVNTVRHRMDHYRITEDDALLQVDPVHFDAGIADVFTALAAGSPTVVLGREQLLDPAQVTAAIERNQVTHVMMVPSLYELLLDAAVPALRGLRQVVLGGERVTESLVARHNAVVAGTELHNDYGPAENTVTSTLCRIDGVTGEVPIGSPVANQWADLLDEHGNLVPFGAPGEICVGGAGLARGYLADPAGTACRFVPSPVRGGARMYRTGDLAARMSDGRLRYLGRIDDQVKIRGQRVEPGEVAAVLARAGGVRRAVVVAQREPEPRLVAYVVGDADPAALRAFLAQRLPAVMIPEIYVPIPELPALPNGKLDPAALPAPPTSQVWQPGTPMSPAQRRVAEVWAELLGRPVTDLDVSLFRLGGHSLTAARIGHELGIAVSTVFANPTVRELAGVLPQQIALRPAAVGTASGPVPLSNAQRRVWLAARRTSADAFIVATVTRTGRPIDAAALRVALAAVMRRQHVLRLHVTGRGTRAEQVVLDEVDVPLVVVDLPGAAPDGPQVAAALREGRAVSFDLSQAPLFEVRLLTGVAGGALLMITAHHLIYDGASVQILLDDLWRAYDQVLARGDAWLPPLSHTYLDAVVAERAWLAGDEAAREIEFWRGRLAGMRPSPDPVDPARRGVTRGATGFARRTLPWEVIAGASATPFAIVVTAFTTTLARTTGARDLVLGFAASLRHHPAADTVVGYLANAVPLRLRFDGHRSLGELLAHVTERSAEAYQHSRVPFDVLVEQLRLPAPPGRSVLLDLGVSWENAVVGDTRHHVEDVLPDHLPASSDLWLYASHRGDRLHLDLTYDDNLVYPDEANALADWIQALVTDVVARPATEVDPTPRPDDQHTSWTGTHYDF